MGVPLFNAVAILLCVTFSPLTLQAHMATTQTTTKTLTKEPTVFNIFSFGAQGLGQTNDTAAAQRTLDAAASCPTRPAIALLPANGTYKFGGGLHAIGHAYDGVTLLIEGKVIVPTPAWSTQEQCGYTNSTPAAGGIFRSLCSMLTVMNVDRFTFGGHGSVTGFLFDEHKQPLPPGGFWFVNTTNLIVEDLTLSHFEGLMWIHFSQDAMVRNVSLINRDKPEETGDIEIGGMGSHGVGRPQCEADGGCDGPSMWQYNLPLLRPNNITMRDSFVTGGDDNVCIKNDTSNVLVENVVFANGHGASIGSVPDCYGCTGYVTNLTYRNCTFGGNAPMKIKTWANTTGEISNILFEDCVLRDASTAIEISANYGGNNPQH